MRDEIKTVRYICDRCKKETKYRSWMGLRRNPAIAFLIWLTGAESILEPEYKRVDLCSNCRKSFVEWLKGSE